MVIGFGLNEPEFLGETGDAQLCDEHPLSYLKIRTFSPSVVDLDENKELTIYTEIDLPGLLAVSDITPP